MVERNMCNAISASPSDRFAPHATAALRRKGG
jgi:hypothetical protein